MLGRLRITQRLSLLLSLPLAAVVLISVPFTVQRVNEARAAAAIVDSARDALAVGAVILDLQQERLLALAYLASPAVNRPALVAQNQSTVDSADRALLSLAGPATQTLTTALTGLDRLADQRESILSRRSSVTEVYAAYRAAVVDLIGALQLDNQPGADAAGVRQLSSLDALLRTNEQANEIGAALVVSSVDPRVGSAYAVTAKLLRDVYLDNLRQLGDPVHLDLLDQQARGPAATRTNELLGTLTAGQSPIAVDDSVSAAQTSIVIGRSLQDRIARDIATGASRRAEGAAAAATVVAALAATLLALVLWLGTAVSRSVARPLRRVTLAATAVADLAAREMVRASELDSEQQGPPRLAALTLHTADEIGELASAFNRVQATAALLMEQQVTTRRNVAVMFGNIANRTQSLVARQLAQIDELERNERDEQRLTGLYRLDHLTARLRRSADSLLAIAGTRDEARLAAPTPLAEVIRSATAEVEGYLAVQLGSIENVTVQSAAVPDLTLLLAELLENATAFSPPDVPVEVSASLRDATLIQIVDRGIGMKPERLVEENRRLVARERLDVAPTAMLGLFVVGRLARRHNIDVRLVATAGGGVTAEVRLPANVFLGGGQVPTFTAGSAPPSPTAIASGPPVPLARTPWPAPSQLGAAVVRNDFGWFDQDGPTAELAGPTVNGRHTAAGEQRRGDLRRRQPGRAVPGLDPPAERRSEFMADRDPQGERAALDAFAAGAARAGMAGADPDPIASMPRPRQSGHPPAYMMGQPPPASAPAEPRHGLHRRRPGEHLAESLRVEVGRHTRRSADAAGVPAQSNLDRDANAERAQLTDYLTGLARAGEGLEYPHDPWSRS